jgi:hypothetical protein
MSKYRYIATAAGLIVAGLALAACTNATATPAATPTPTVSPADQLAAALGKLKGQGYDVAITAGSSTTGKASVDPSRQAAQDMVMGEAGGQAFTVTIVQVGSSMWTKVDLGQTGSTLGLDPTKWLLIDQSKMTGPNSKHFDLSGPDAFDVTGLMASTAGVKATDATHLTGTVDLTAATGINQPAKDALTQAGDKAKAVPFTAALDDQGRLTDLGINAAGINSNLSETFSYSNYGSPSAITAPPASDVIPAPVAFYTLFGTQ